MIGSTCVSADGYRTECAEQQMRPDSSLGDRLQREPKMHPQLTDGRARIQALKWVLNGLCAPVLLATAEAKVLFMNDAAERLIRASDGLALQRGRLRALFPEDTRSLHALMAEAAQAPARQVREPRGVLRVARPGGRQPLEVLVSAIALHAGEQAAQQPAMVALLVGDPSRAAIAEESPLIRHHGLTVTEAKVSLALCRGLSTGEICQKLGIRYNTVKTHLKRIYAKTGTKRQADLVRFLAESWDVTGLALGSHVRAPGDSIRRRAEADG
jgi:DNA-binding CsgD family transcriptional regulator